jgi:uroporphyrin-III C-methyltransferase
MKTNIYPKLTIIGAGPGDPELITVKGINALSKADVILYDALANEELLKYAPQKAKKIFVGKRRNKHEYKQEEINALIVELATQHGHVVRLKGGDPFVFGRGQEEIKHAELFGIETNYVPGISSATGVPGLAGIPVTHRGVSESFWVITATTQKGKLSNDIADAAKTNATIVVLMGVHKLKEIVNAFTAEGKSNLPIAVIQNGSLLTQKLAIATMSSIEKEVKEKEILSPAIIVIGEVVKSHRNFAWLANDLKQLSN